MLEPLNIDRERAAYTKIDQYASQNSNANAYGYNNGSQSNKMKPPIPGGPIGGSYEDHTR